MKKQTTQKISLWWRFFGLGLGLGVSFVLQLGILFVIVFGYIGWVFIAPKAKRWLKR